MRIIGIHVDDWARFLAWIGARIRLRWGDFRVLARIGPSLALRYSERRRRYALTGIAGGFPDLLVLIDEEEADHIIRRLGALREGREPVGPAFLTFIELDLHERSGTVRLAGPTAGGCIGGVHLAPSEADELLVALGMHRDVRWGRRPRRADAERPAPGA